MEAILNRLTEQGVEYELEYHAKKACVTCTLLFSGNAYTGTSTSPSGALVNAVLRMSRGQAD